MSSWQKHLAGRGWGPWHIKPPGPAEAGRNSTMAGSEEVQRATALIEERLAQEEENEVGLGWGPKGVLGTPSSAVKGRQNPAAVHGRKVSSRAQLVLFQGAPERGLLVVGNEGFSPQILRDKWRAKLGSPRPCLLTWALRKRAKLHRTGQPGCGLGVQGPEIPQLLGGRLGQKKLQCLVPEER